MTSKRKRTRPSKVKPLPYQDIAKRLEQFLGQITPDVVQRLTKAEARATRAERDLELIKNSLVAVLLPDQVEAAKIAGCEPHIYALEWIKLWLEKSEWRDKVFPSFAPHVENLTQLRREY